MNQLSGGEKLKTALACALLGPSVPQLLLLDEPGNHLDLDAQEVLIQALMKFKGALMIACHDSHFVSRIEVDTELKLQAPL